jgi:fumarylpyruvate hydrolase
MCGAGTWEIGKSFDRSAVLRAFELMPGDIIYSGTPENVGPVVKGDVMDAHIDGLPDLRVKVV